MSILRERVVDLRVGIETRGFQAGLDHPQPAERKDGALEGLIGLQSDDDLVLPVDITGLVRQHGRRCLGVDGENAFLSLVLEVRLQLRPDRLGALGRTGQETLVAVVRSHVPNDEVAHIDGFSPASRHEAAPGLFIFLGSGKSDGAFHDVRSRNGCTLE